MKRERDREEREKKVNNKKSAQQIYTTKAKKNRSKS